MAVTALAVLLLALRAMGGGPTPAGAAVPLRLDAAASGAHVAVHIENYAFSPAALTVDTGTTVTWTNMDTAPHTVTVSSGPVTFASPQLQKGQSFSYTFTKLGTYKYYCAVHPDMVASVQVVAAPTTAPAPAAPATAAPTHSSHPTKHAVGKPAGTRHSKHHAKRHHTKKHTKHAAAAAPASTATPATAGGMDMGSSACAGANAALNMFLQHVYAGHLGESPSQQAADITNADQYVKTHTVLIAGLLDSLLGGARSAVDQLIMHIDAGHLGESPSQQAADISNADQYALTHTVLVSNMLQAVVGSC